MPETLRGLFLLDSVTHCLYTANSDDKDLVIGCLAAANPEELLQLSMAWNAALVSVTSGARPATPAAKPKASEMRGSASASTEPAVKAKPKPAPEMRAREDLYCATVQRWLWLTRQRTPWLRGRPMFATCYPPTM